jgi:hypothetical protein
LVDQPEEWSRPAWLQTEVQRITKKIESFTDDRRTEPLETLSRKQQRRKEKELIKRKQELRQKCYHCADRTDSRRSSPLPD